MQTKDKIKYFLISLFLKLIYFIIFCVIIFTIYKIFNWQNIKNRIFHGSPIATTTITYNLPIQNKDKELSLEEEKYLNDLSKRFKTQEININKIDIVYPDAYMYKEDSDFYIKVSFRNNLERTWNNFVSIYLDPVFKKDFQNGVNDIEYIDLRFSNKVFYRNKGDKKDEQQEKPLATSTGEVH